MIFMLALFKALLIDPEEVDVEDFGHISKVNDALVVLCMASYGEGEPTDNAQQFHEYVANTDIDLSGVRYAVSILVFTAL